VTPSPDDALEARLRSRPAPPLPPRLRRRVLSAVGRARPSRLRFAVGLAASLLIGLNLALLAAGSPAASPWPSSLNERVSTLRTRRPDLSPEEATYLALHGPADPSAGSPWLPIDLAGAGPSPYPRVP
jgi:hypothetical protein